MADNLSPTPCSDDASKLREAALRRKLRQIGLRQNVRTLLRFVGERSREIKLAEVSSSMALATLLAIIPVLVLSVAVFAVFPSFAGARQTLEELIWQSFLPEQYSAQLVHILKELAGHAAGLTTFGIVGLTVTALMLIDKLFVTVNRIFAVRRVRSWQQRALIYWALLTIGPLVLAVSLTITGHAAALALEGADATVSTALLTLGRLALQVIFFAAVYKFVPNTRVPMAHALAGGCAVVAISQLVREGFSMFVSLGTMTTVYGAFAAIPVLILWIYIGWYLFFAGAAVTATIPKLAAGRMQDGLTQGNDFLTSLVMLRALVERSQRGKNPVLTEDELCDAADTYPAFVERNMGLLEKAGYVANATLEKKAGESCWALVADPAKATLRPAFEVFAVSGDNSLVRSRGKVRGDEPALLEDWWRTLASSPALTTPLLQLWPRKDG